MKDLHNIEKSLLHPDRYVGYAGGAVFVIKKNGQGNWEAIPCGEWPKGLNSFPVSGTLAKLSIMLDALDVAALSRT